jgi:hypothetical protein
MAFHAFVNDAAEAGQDPDITKPWTGIWLRHSCPPLWRLTLVSVSSRPHALIAGRLRTHCIQSIPEAGSSTLVDGAVVPLHGIIAQLAFLFATAERDHSQDVTTSKYSTANFKIITILAEFSFHRCSLFST